MSARPGASGQTDRSGHASPDAGPCPKPRRGPLAELRPHPRRANSSISSPLASASPLQRCAAAVAGANPHAIRSRRDVKLLVASSRCRSCVAFVLGALLCRCVAVAGSIGPVAGQNYRRRRRLWSAALPSGDARAICRRRARCRRRGLVRGDRRKRRARSSDRRCRRRSCAAPFGAAPRAAPEPATEISAFPRQGWV